MINKNALQRVCIKNRKILEVIMAKKRKRGGCVTSSDYKIDIPYIKAAKNYVEKIEDPDQNELIKNIQEYALKRVEKKEPKLDDSVKRGLKDFIKKILKKAIKDILQNNKEDNRRKTESKYPESKDNLKDELKDALVDLVIDSYVK